MRDIIMNRITFEVNCDLIFEFDPIKEKYMNMDDMQNLF